MTTIAYRNGVLAGDGRETDVEHSESSIIVGNNFVKVHRLKDGRLFGAAGSSEDMLRLLFALQNNQTPPKLEDISALLIDPKGKVSLYEGSIWQPVREKYYSIGSGSRFALPAMDAGATAVEAVKIGIKRDPFSGGKITVVKLRK